MITENFKMFDDNGKRTDDINKAYVVVIENESGSEGVRKLLRENKESCCGIYGEGVYYWDEVVDCGYRRFSDWEVEMFKKVFATL